MSTERKVWTVQLPEEYEYPYTGEVLIEQFGDAPPTIAFRPQHHAVWARPIQSVEAP
jgi:hypothetical protein